MRIFAALALATATIVLPVPALAATMLEGTGETTYYGAADGNGERQEVGSASILWTVELESASLLDGVLHLERLSSGYRINSAKDDDAAGLQIPARLTVGASESFDLDLFVAAGTNTAEVTAVEFAIIAPLGVGGEDVTIATGTGTFTATFAAGRLGPAIERLDLLDATELTFAHPEYEEIGARVAMGSASATRVPEPAALGLLAGAGLAGARRRRR